ncbi:site-specific integrase [Knoellia locipacati]|uniref:Site-specific integrase n=1 Tax=Knoellia locipacati TaxID=882824 RepID=A0A512T4I6_9MICO|nr:site-specific integrase [Knoellia locipacati]GEQ15130.1 site-specific integrase [Knoellia locipacati]
MASIQKRPDGRWRARYRDASGKEHARHFTRKVDAQRYLDEVTTAIGTGHYVDPTRARMTVQEWAERWIQTYSSRRPATVRQAQVQLRRIVARFGARRLADLRPSDIKAWTTEMASEGLKESTIYSNYRRLAQLLGDAAHDGLIPRSPCSRRTSPRQPPQRPFVPTTEQVFALYDALSEHLRPAVLLGAFAGLRISEAVALRADDVDFTRGVVAPAVQHGDTPLKSTASGAPVPIPQDLALQLAGALQRSGGTTLATDAAGRATTPWAVRRAIAAAKASNPNIPGELRFHDLRHYYASLLIGSGLDIKVVQTRLRHASATTTLNTYGHLWPDADESARAAVGQVLAARADSLRTQRIS